MILTYIVLLFSLCLGHVQTDWVLNKPLQRHVIEATRGITPKTYQLNLDLPANERWTHIVQDNIQKLKAATAYFDQFIPKALKPLVIKIGQKLQKVFPDYKGELQGIATASGIDVGEITVLNLVYQLEDLFVNCSAWNTTGPGCDSQFPIGLCTSIIAQDASGNIVHGRNLDFNFTPELNELIANIEFQRGGKTIFTGTTLVGFVGIMNGMKPDAFSYSINARDRGGDVLENFASLLTGNCRTPTQHARLIFESCEDYACAKRKFQSKKLANPVYYTIGGSKAGEGAVITRDRLKTADVLELSSITNTIHKVSVWPPAIKKHKVRGFEPWYKLQTNYDNWKDPPAADNRRDPGNEFMQGIGQAQISQTSMYHSVLLRWPTFNPHTDWTSVFSASYHYYNTTVWIRDE